MSVVIAVKDPKTGSIFVGCDSQVSAGNIKYKLKGESSKIWRYNDLPIVIVGGVGSLRDIQLAQTCHDLIDELSLYKGHVDFEYCVTTLYTRLHKLLLDNGRVPLDNKGNPMPTIGSQFLLAVGEHAFTIDIDGAIEEINDYLVMGSGAEVAIGVLENNKNKSAKQRIKEAIQACADKTLYVNNDIKILSTYDTISKSTLEEYKK